MHVLLCSHYLPPHIGGIEVVVDSLAHHLREEGHRVTIVSSAVGAPGESGDPDTVRIPAWNVLEEKLQVPFPIFSPAILPALNRAVREADVVHAHGVLYLTSWVALLFCWWHGKPLVTTEHVGFVPYESRFLSAVQRLALRLATPLFLRGSQAFLAFNQRVFDWLRTFAIHPERLFFAANGVDTDDFRPARDGERERARRELGLSTAAPLALFVGRFVQKKRPDLLLQAGDASFELLLCGHGELPHRGSESVVHVLRDVDHDKMPLVYRAADILVLPSQGEGFPIAIMEAMASGLPAVACRDAAYDDYVTGDEVEQVEADPADIRRALCGLASNDAERQRRSALVRQRAVEDFSIRQSARRHAEIYKGARQTLELAREFGPMSFDLATQAKLPALRSLLRPTAPTGRLDVGPGTGYLANALLDPGPIVVVDIAADNLLALRQHAQRAGADDRFLPVRADLMHLPFKDASLDTVLCTQVLEHVGDDRRAARELARIVADDGQLLAEVPHIEAGYASHLERLGVRTVHDEPGPEFHHRPGYTRTTLEELFDGTNLEIADSKTSLGRLTMLTVDAIALVHLAYQRLRYGRTSWTWADVGAMADSPVLRIYRALFPLLRLSTLLDRIVPGRTGFILAARLEPRGRGGDRGEPPLRE